MVIDLILLILGLAGLLIATYSDKKTTEIPDWLNFSLIASGLSLRALYSITYNDFFYIKIALINLVIFYLIGNIMFYSKQWGGGDAKLLMALSVVFATYPKQLLNIFSPRLDNIYFPAIIFLNILIIGMIYSLIFTIYISLKHKKDFLREYNLYLKKTKNPRKIILILSILLIVLAIIVNNFLSRISLFFIAIAILLFLYLWIYIKSVEKSCMYKTIKPSELIEGDWLTKNIYKNSKLLLKIPMYGLNKEQISLLKKNKIQKVEIKEGIIFTPTFLIATIISLIFGNIISYFL
ncbi:MAG: A24 family peptidase [Nanoarchaeota archaeon]|nr:A24 family peptidase [Nanoarchaeota archaeon]